MTVRAPKACRIGLALMLVSTIAPLAASCFDSDEVRDEAGTGTGTDSESETGE